MQIMGHRGARDRALENTLESFKAAMECGVDIIELDIHETRDGVWIIHHDECLERIANAAGMISEKTAEEISQLRTTDGQVIPTLEEFLKLIINSEIRVQIEIKSTGNLYKLIQLIKKYLLSHRVTFISFNHRWLREIKELSAGFTTACLLYGLPINVVDIVRSADADGISVNTSWIDKQLVDECHAAGFFVTVWNVNDEKCFQKMLEMGVDIVATDVPFSTKIWHESALKEVALKAFMQ